MSRDEIEQAIEDDPDDLGNFAVLADWLQAKHPTHPRGELIALMIALEGADGFERERLKREVQLAFDRGIDLLLGDLAKHGKLYDAPPYVWRAGFIDRIEAASLKNPHTIVTDALAHESGQFVRTLIVAGAERNVREAVARVAKRPRLLRRLEIANDTSIGQLDALWPAVPRLRHLAIEAPFETRDFALPNLESARFKAPFDPLSFQAVCRARWPKLAQLRIMYTGETSRFDDIAPLFERTDMPALRHLALQNFKGIERRMIERLLEAPWLAQLRSLSLLGNWIGDDEAFLLADEPTRFRPDLSLEVEKHRFSRRGIAALRVLDPRL